MVPFGGRRQTRWSFRAESIPKHHPTAGEHFTKPCRLKPRESFPFVYQDAIESPNLAFPVLSFLSSSPLIPCFTHNSLEPLPYSSPHSLHHRTSTGLALLILSILLPKGNVPSMLEVVPAADDSAATADPVSVALLKVRMTGALLVSLAAGGKIEKDGVPVPLGQTMGYVVVE